jgi:hypothetical protein
MNYLRLLKVKEVIMKKKMLVVMIGVLMIGLALAGVTYAQTMPSLLNESHNDLDDPYFDDDMDLQAVCSGEITHPALDRLAEEYEVDYHDLLTYFCDKEFGIGEIMHALITAELDDVEFTYDELLDWRYDVGIKGVGWGEIWQELGLIGTEMPDLEEDDGLNPVCAGDLIHPALHQLAERFDVAYPELLVFFCEGQFGIGEIKLALETAQREGVELSYDDILGTRSKDDETGQGWGQIWQGMGLIGRGRLDHEGPTELDEHALPGQNENSGPNNKPVVPPGQSGEQPGKGRGPKN